MNSYNLNLPLHKTSTSEELITVIQSYRSVENKRIALRKAFARKPNDPRLQQILGRLTSTEYISKAAQRGVFINYSRHDELLAVEVAERLQQAGLYVWLDMLDIGYGADWEHEIRRAIHGCGLMISILSPRALRDEPVNRERQHFIKAGKLVVPLISQHLERSPMDLWLPPVDFTRGFQDGIQQLYGLLNLSMAGV